MARVGFVHWIVLHIISPLWRLVRLLKVEGRDNLPKQGGYVVGMSHPGYIDPIDVVAAHPGPLYGLGRKEEFTRPITGRILRNDMRMIPLDRSGGDNRPALEEAVQRLRQGEAFFMAPEGGRNRFGPLGRGKTGITRLALEAGVPMVPAACFRRRGWRPKVMFGAPMDTSEWHGRQDDQVLVREVTDRFMLRLADMLGEPYDPATAQDNQVRLGIKQAPPRS